VIYDISHRTTYRYSIPVSFSHHLLHVTPRPCPRQTCERTMLVISPNPARHTAAIDFFGNPTTYVTIQEQHRELVIHAKSVLSVEPAPAYAPESTAAWETIFSGLAHGLSPVRFEVLQYCFESPYAPFDAAIARYARVSFPAGRPVLAGALDLTRRIHEEFTYDPSATTVSTPVGVVFRNRYGVCQDFAHLQIAALRALRLPARYVSGYLLTRPPDGRERLVGSDASHAWISIWCPEQEWVDLDPTNDLLVSDEHITLAWGRDYGDVSPVRGAIFGGGTHSVHVGVDVIPLDAGARRAPPSRRS
jgi:transglutaminase-like putative cysteine protease